MRVGPRANALIRHFAVGALYCATLFLISKVTFTHWIIVTGFHLSVLLLSRYRYWPALALGGLARMAYVSIDCYPQYGALWATINLAPAIAYYIPVVWAFRERGLLFPRQGTFQVVGLVLCAFVVATIATGITLGQLLLTPLPPNYVLDYSQVVPRLVLGNLLGVLTVAPTAMVLAQLASEARGQWRSWFHEVADSRLLFETVFVAMPIMLFVGWVGFRDAQNRPVAQMAMFLPVVFLALRHGWKGAAFAGTLASVGIMLLMPAEVDANTLRAETLVALAIATMLLVGEHVTGLHRRAEQERVDSRTAMALAQRNVELGESQLRSAAVSLERTREAFDVMLGHLLTRFSHYLPVAEDRRYRRLAEAAKGELFLLSDAMHPLMYRDRGLPGMLSQGALARHLEAAGVAFWCDVRGPVSVFPLVMHLAAYRLICDTVSDACAARNVSEVRIKVRCGTRRPQRMMVLVQTIGDPHRLAHIGWDRLLPSLRLLSSGLGRRAIEDRAATYQGSLRERPLPQGRRLLISLQHPGQPHP